MDWTAAALVFVCLVILVVDRRVAGAVHASVLPIGRR